MFDYGFENWTESSISPLWICFRTSIESLSLHTDDTNDKTIVSAVFLSLVTETRASIYSDKLTISDIKYLCNIASSSSIYMSDTLIFGGCFLFLASSGGWLKSEQEPECMNIICCCLCVRFRF